MYLQYRECQKADWAVHKALCKHNEEAYQRLVAACDSREFDALRRWKSVHTPALKVLAVQELGVYADPSKGAHAIFVVDVQARPRETDRRKRFEITHAAALPIEFFGGIVPHIRQMYDVAQVSDGGRFGSRLGSQLDLGTYMIAIMLEGSWTPDISPVKFLLGSALPAYRDPAAIIVSINNGEVF